MKKLSLNKILDNSNLLISSIGVSSIGDTVFNITIMWFIYQETQSAISTSIIGVLWHLTSIFISPFAGTFVDRHTPNRVLLWSYFASGLICILFVLGYIILEYRDFVIYSSVFLLNSINTFIMPAKNRTLGKIVQKEKIPQVNGLIVSVNQISDIIGNSISGLLIGILGFAGSILFDSITFFIASLLISHLKIKRLDKDQNITGFVETNQYKGNYKKDLIDGIKFILRHRTMGKLVLLVLLINISSLVGPLYIILVNEQFKGGPTEYGILQILGALGSIIGGLSIKYFNKLISLGKGLFVSWIIAGILMAFLSVTSLMIVGYIIFFFYCFFLVLGNIIFSSLKIVLVEDKYRGRIEGVTYSLSSILIPLSTLLGGILAEYTNVSIVFTFSGLWIVFVGIIFFFDKELKQLKHFKN
ncbi:MULTISPECIES: MFS transporter [Bacillaceae]|uniref:MFS transporter n=1 Tax=Bacillaceae TaxID=186817 RepID=UPI00203E388B|nr:MFS transporter [Caldibacillus thermoamylovorans]MCM3055873.1 MFS transporter [Caldibacillus thermoamylovorans]